MAYVTLAELDQATNRRWRRGSGFGMGQTPIPTCFLALPTNTSVDEAQRRWTAMTEDQRQALRAPIMAQLKAASPTITDDQARSQAEQRAINDIVSQVMRERANPRLCVDVIRSLFYTTLGSQLSESLFTPDAVARIKQAALANGVPTDQIETLYAQAKAALGPLPQFTPQQAVVAAIEQVMTAAGAPLSAPLSYTRERLFAIRDEAIRRGANYEQATRYMRDEITRRLGVGDPNPNGDIDDLLRTIMPQSSSAPPSSQSYVQVPTYSQPAPVAPPPFVPAATQPEPSRRQQRPARDRAPKQQYPAWLIPAAAVGGVGLIALLLSRR